MTTLYTILYTAYVTFMACFAFWCTHQRERRRYEDAGWDNGDREDKA